MWHFQCDTAIKMHDAPFRYVIYSYVIYTKRAVFHVYIYERSERYAPTFSNPLKIMRDCIGEY